MSVDRDMTDIPTDEIIEISTPSFKTFNVGNHRKGIRLENVFWTALQVAAKSSNRKVSEFIEPLVLQAEELGANSTSVIRSSILHAIMRKLKSLEIFSDTDELTRLFQLAPCPAFALDRQKRLVHVNSDFMRYIQTIGGLGGQPVHVSTAKLTLDVPLDKIFAELEPGQSTTSRVSIGTNHIQRQVSSKLITLPPAPSRIVIGYIT